MSAIVAAPPAVGPVRPDLPAMKVASLPPTSRPDFQAILSAFRNAQPQAAPVSSQPAQAVYRVKSGDTLSGICASSLRGAGERPSRADIMDAVRRVATANGLSNADRISVGQQLDLSTLKQQQAAAASAGPANPVPAVAPQGGAAMAPTEYGLAVLAEAISSIADARTGGDEAERIQRMIGGPTRITSEFGLRKSPFTGRSEFHGGIDVAAAAGAQVYPVRPGEVTFSGWQSGYGKVVVVSHGDGTETVYAHNQRNLVRRGQQVGWNTPVARVGSTGDSTGPHVHFEVRRNGRAVNPTATATASLEVAQTS